MAKKLLFLYNPFAGQGKIKTHLSDVLDIFTKGGYQVTVRPTQSVGDAQKFISRHGKSYECVVVSGGDGTFSEGVNGVMQIAKERRPALGYLPAGTVNDFANSLNISKNPIEAAKAIVNQNQVYCDFGVAGDHYFSYVAAFGAFTEVSYTTPQNQKNVFGQLAYFLNGIQHLSMLQTYYLRGAYDDIAFEGDFIYGMLSNSYSVGGFKGFTGKDVSLNDGLLEMMLIQSPQDIGQLNEILLALIMGNFDACKLITTKKVKSLHITCEAPVAFTFDGEDGGKHTDISFSVLHDEVKLYV